ncbi:MAG: antitoxin VbhA family protein [Agathobacter sp.]|nr:antitoxin VbhA family protein [Agathobacter sp.]MBQ2283472.1 antitoxin VbhA family protein [Agathobacter sp.]
MFIDDKDLRLQTEVNQSYIDEREARKKNVENAMAIMLSATNGSDKLFEEVLNAYILGEITLEELEKRIDRFEYLETR